MAYTYIDSASRTYWRFNYRRPVSKKYATMSLGVYPTVILAMARKMRDKYRELLAQNIDPSVEKKFEEYLAKNAPENTFEKVAREFMKTESVISFKF